ncbi:hypothetical protein ALC62_01005 [Cyphomyrmex costatus]|uniref:Uncharacterized protein n=1 Tax=Cyphomyrmex costatus TaxID=456900 RepID=A0A151IQ38_9HYME|nr:hypothetical protein ALC62_01005 [Cyphomyrmex costatus]
MSLTFVLTDKSSVLAVSYFPAVDLSDGDYELGLTDFETYSTLPNVNSTNNKFYFDNEEIVIPEGSYELRDIERYLKREILRSRGVKRKEDDEYPLVIRANNNTMKIVGFYSNILDCDNVVVETLDAHYEDVESLRCLDACNTIRCGRHAKNCALQNVFKIFNWWSQHQE